MPFAKLGALVALVASCVSVDGASCVVDWTQSGVEVNRGLLSVHGVMQAYIEPDPNAMRTFQLTNPTGTDSRLETWIGRMEPGNDNGLANVFNWGGFRPLSMLRFLDNRTAFDQRVDQLGMSRLLLLCYNVPWLYSGNDADPVGNKDEWAEFAAACIQAYNGTGNNPNPPVPFVEIWNEPNLTFFYPGTKESYFALYKKAADRIHQNYPGVLVGGPAVSPDGDPTTFLNAHLAEAGADTDVLTYHCYGHSVSKIVSDVQSWSAKFRAIPGKSQGLISITETDYATTGWTKSRYMIDRHFRLFAIQHLLHSVHQFCALAYNESGNYVFGMFDKHGQPIDGTFWPYWIFRGLMGNLSPATLSGSDATSFDCLASNHTNTSGAQLFGAVLRNKTSTTRSAVTTLKFATSSKPRVLVIERLGQTFKGVSGVISIPPGQTSVLLSLSLSAYETVSTSLRDIQSRHLGYQDIFNQEGPWTTISTSNVAPKVGDKVTVTVNIVNTTGRTFQGYVNLGGLPSAWRVALSTGKSTVRLDAGETATRALQFTVGNSLGGGTFGLYATLNAPGTTRGGLVEKSRSLPVTTTVP